ncbi:MAG: hypothetical protein IV107_21110 [Paucibacter sp.]|nr:hypothetical protein [Roseateles sp.]
MRLQPRAAKARPYHLNIHHPAPRDPGYRKWPIRLLAAGLLCASLPAAHAVTTSWIAAGGGNWEDAANWSAGVPQMSDMALVTPLTKPASGVVINTATTIAGLGLANVNMRVAADLTVTGATTWDESGAFAGNITFANAANIWLAGSLSLTGNTAKGVNNTGVLDLAGATSWSGSLSAGGSNLTVGITSPNTVMRNRGVFTDSNGFDTSISGRGTFDNQGNFVKSGASLTRIDVADFRNSGSVTVSAGTLVLPTMSGVHSGSWQVNAGSVLNIAGGTPTLTGTLGGGGTLLISGGTVTVEGFGRNVPTLLDGGTLAGSHQVFDGPFTWRTGALAGNGITLLTGTVTLEGSAAKVIGAGRDVTSYGQTTWSGGALTIGQGGALPTTFVNNGEFRDIDGGSRTLNGIGFGLSTFVNADGYVKTGAGRTLVSSLLFDNQGSLDVRAGLMQFTAGLSNSGLIHTAAGAGVLVTAAVPLENTGTLAGDGAIDAVMSIINRGLISPGSSIGTLTAGSVTLAPEGTLKIELGDAGEADLLKLTGTVVLGGTLDLWNAGYTPQLGDSFEVLQFGSRSGTSSFDAIRLNGFGQGLVFDVLYGTGDVRLVVTAVPEPGVVALWLTGLCVLGGLARRGGRAKGGAQNFGI